MALTPERIIELEQQSYVDGRRPVITEDYWGDEKVTYEPTKHFNMFMFARAVEAEVRKQDTELIRQMLDALASLGGCGTVIQWEDQWERCVAAITAARARQGGGIFAPESAHLFTQEAAVKAFAHVKPLGES